MKLGRLEGRFRRAATRPDDAGFTLIEVIISVMLIGIVMTSLSTFLVSTMAISSQQSGKQVAIQLAEDATDVVRSLRGSALAVGRDATSSHTQWNAPVTGVAAYQADMTEYWENAAVAGSGATAALPTTPVSVVVNGITFRKYWYLGKCWQPSGGGACTTTAGYAEFYRVVVAVTWTEKRCPSATCSYVTSVLVSTGSSEPVFNTNLAAVAPTVTAPATYSDAAGVADATGVQLSSTGGASPVLWSATGLPPGITCTVGGLCSGTPTTPGLYSVRVTATDAFLLTRTATIAWTVTGPPTITTPGSQTSEIGIAISGLQISAANGTTPYTWAATAALPPGVSINSTGRIVGTPSTVGSWSPVIRVTDATGRTASTSPFTWTVVAGPTITSPAATRNNSLGDVVSLTPTATGGIAPYTWSVTGALPTGLSMNASGVISGTLTAGGTFTPTIRVTDSVGGVRTVAMTWKVLAITNPTAADRSDRRNRAITPFTATATGGTGPYTWAITTPPPGISINSTTGVVSGTLGSTRTTYVTTVTVTDTATGLTESITFDWTVTN